MPSKRWGVSMQSGHHLHTRTTSISQGVSYGETLETLNTQWSTRVRSEWCGCIWKPYETKIEEKTHWLHKYPWNLALGYTGLQWLDSNRHQCVGLLQNAPKHQYSPLLDPTPILYLGQSNKHTQGLTLATVRAEIKEMTKTRGLEVKG